MPWAISSVMYSRAARSGSPATERPTGRTCTRRTWRSGSGRYCFRGKAAYPYNVGSPHDLTIADLARTVVGAVAAGTTVEIARQPIPGAPPLRYVPRTARANEELGLRPLISRGAGGTSNDSNGIGRDVAEDLRDMNSQ